MNANEQCLCGSGEVANLCCMPLINGKAEAQTPEALMRSRYTAYALGGCGEYLMRTWVDAAAQGLDAKILNRQEVCYTGLTIEGSGEQGDQGWVRFTACFTEPDGTRANMTEHSLFVRQNDRWRYLLGKQL